METIFWARGFTTYRITLPRFASLAAETGGAGGGGKSATLSFVSSFSSYFSSGFFTYYSGGGGGALTSTAGGGGGGGSSASDSLLSSDDTCDSFSYSLGSGTARVSCVACGSSSAIGAGCLTQEGRALFLFWF